jgi:PAS domain S-box-containing protein
MGAKRAAQDEEFRALLDAVPTGVLSVDALGLICLVNVQIEKMFGYSRDEMIGRHVEMLIPPRLRRKHVGLRKQFTADPQSRPMGTGRDLFGVRKDGSEFAIEVGLNPADVGSGAAVVATIADITERKRADEDDRSYEHVQESLQLCEYLGIPATVLQCDGRVLFVNPLFKDLHPQFKFRGDRLETRNQMASEYFKQELARLDGTAGGDRISPTPVPALNGYPAFMFYLLPVKSPAKKPFGILIVTPVGDAGGISVDTVRRLFDLAPDEARVASLIGAGLRPKEAAEKLGISEGTVRTTLKHVFSKVGVSRQSELAVLCSKLALR